MNVTHHLLDGKTQAVNPGGAIAAKHKTTEEIFGWIIRVGGIVAIVLGFAYLIMQNSLATMGFDMETYKQNGLSLQKEAEAWDIELAIPSSLYALESLEQVQAMSDINKKFYLEVYEGEVAMVERSY